MNRMAGKNLRLVLTLTLIFGILWVIYIIARIVWPLPADIFADKTVEPITPELRIDIAEEL